jgi:AraC family transcriptional activator of mtrCDE
MIQRPGSLTTRPKIAPWLPNRAVLGEDWASSTKPVVEQAVRKTVARFAGGDLASEFGYTLRIESSVLCRSVMTPPWGFGVAARDMGSFHLLIDGEGWLEVDGRDGAIRLAAGDLVMLPEGQAHWVKDAPGSAAPALSSIIDAHEIVDGELHFGGDAGPATEIVCGVYRETGPRPFVSGEADPTVIHAPALTGAAWWPTVFAAVRDEVRRPTEGGSAIVNRLLESLLVDAVRGARNALEDGIAPGSSFDDRRIGGVLLAIREHPDRGWTVGTLADVAAMSRSAFAERFRRLVGLSPMRYLTQVRLGRAAELLRTTDATVADVARRVGYASEEAFSRAFRARFGASPGTFRRVRRA